MGLIVPLLCLISVGSSGANASAGLEPVSACQPHAGLKAAYLSCERAALRGGLPAGEIARCSLMYERLKAEVFDGDFRALRAWYEAADQVSGGLVGRPYPAATENAVCG